MNAKRGLLAALGAFAAIFGAEFLIHQVWLGGFYKAHAQWWRPAAEMQSLMPFMFLAQGALAALLTVVYAKGYEANKGGMGQGLRFGLLIGLLLMVPNCLTQVAIYPYPASLLRSWLIGGVAEVTLAGAVIGSIYRAAK